MKTFYSQRFLRKKKSSRNYLILVCPPVFQKRKRNTLGKENKIPWIFNHVSLKEKIFNKHNLVFIFKNIVQIERTTNH